MNDQMAVKQFLQIDGKISWYRQWQEFIDKDPLTLAASIAFYSILSFAPLIAIGLWVISRVSPGSENRLIAELGYLLGQEVHDVAATIAASHHSSTFASTPANIFGICVLLFSSTTAFAQLQSSINIIWGITVKPNEVIHFWLKHRLLSFAMLATLGFLLVITLILSTVATITLRNESTVWVAINEITTLCVYSAAFSILFRFVPDARAAWRHVLTGGIVTAVLFEGGKWVLGVYLTSTAAATAYGAGNTIVSLLLWVYYSALIILVGATFTNGLGHRSQHTLRLPPHKETS